MNHLPPLHLPFLLSRVTVIAIAIAVSATLFSACGGSTSAPSGSPTATVTTPAVGTPTASGGAWRTDLPIGAREGNLSPRTVVLLADGSRATLEKLADGKPLLLYFYATW